MSENPVGFMSYVRFDDKHENGRLSQFCERLSGEVRMQTGEEFHIFQDRNDIAWGQQWQQRLDESLDAVTLLIPILTPSFFKSVACRGELERFLDREKQLGRGDLILPVYYVDCPVLSDETKRKADSLAKIIAGRQYFDWRELRFEPFTSPQVGKAVARMASQICKALERSKPSPPAPAPGPAGPKDAGQSAPATDLTREAGAKSPESARRSAQKTEPPTLVVDAFHRGDQLTVTGALKAAHPGDRILIRRGLYKEGIVIDKPVEIIGDGELGEVVIEAKGKNVVLFQATMGRITNVTLRQTGGRQERYCVDIAQGRLDLEGCDITSQSSACVAIHAGADPRLRRNVIHDAKLVGVLVSDNGQGTLEDNDIFANRLSGVEIMEGGNPTLRHNRIHDGKMAGVMVWGNSQGTLEDNDIFANAHVGVAIIQGGNPTLRRNHIHDGKSIGVLVSDSAQGTLEDNDIVANAGAGVEISEGGNPILRRNRISKNAYQGIRVHDGGQGVFEDNDVRGNAKGAWNIARDCQDKVTRSGNRE
jgi:F-box protein 11